MENELLTNDEDIEIEINIFLIFIRALKSFLNNTNFRIWSAIAIIIIISSYTVPIKEDFQISSLLAPGITGLSFTLALITATTRIFDYKDLASIFKYVDKTENVKLGDEYYDLIGSYLLTGFVWVVVSIIALIDKFFFIDYKWIEILALLMTMGGIIGLWQLLYAHIQDVAEKVENELNRENKDG